MKCKQCLVAFHDNPSTIKIGVDADGGWIVEILKCPQCKKMNLFLVNGEPGYDMYAHFDGLIKICNRVSIRPRGNTRPPCPPVVPVSLSEDYQEACLVLPDSPKASAALSRRCLQNLLREKANVKAGELANEIQQVIDSGKLRTHLVESIDAVRNIGNFAAHPLKSQSTGQIVPVEPEEAEWNLDVFEAFLTFTTYSLQLFRKNERL